MTELGVLRKVRLELLQVRSQTVVPFALEGHSVLVGVGVLLDHQVEHYLHLKVEAKHPVQLTVVVHARYCCVHPQVTSEAILKDYSDLVTSNP